MSIDVRFSGPVAIVDVVGKLTLTHGDQEFRVQVGQLLTQGARSILINLAAVPYMDSAAIGTLMASYKHTVQAGGAMKLLNPERRVYDVLQLVKLDTVFKVFTDEATACASFGE